MPVKPWNILTEDAKDYVPFINGTEKISFERFRSDVQKCCFLFRQIETPSVILYVANDVYLFYVCFMALMHAQKDVILPAYLTKEMLSDLKKFTTVVISNKDFADTDISVIKPSFDDKTPKAELEPIQDRIISFFTSGSTSKPKQIPKKFDMLAKEVQMHSQMQQKVICQNPVVIATIMPNHMYGMLWRLLYPLSNRLTQDLDTVISPEEIQHKQHLYSKVLFITTPTFMTEVASYAQQYTFDQNCLAIYSSGGLLPARTSEKMFQLFGVSPFEVFGSTETGGVGYRQQVNGPAFCIFPTVKIEKNAESCLRVQSDFSFRSPYDMQDLIEYTDGGDSFILLGRNDRMIKIAENRVSLNEMEEKLNQNEYVYESYFLSIQTDRHPVLASVICLNEKGKERLKNNGKLSLVRELKSYLSAWYDILPRKIRFVYKISKNPQGKILKKEMEKLFETPISEPVVQNVKFRNDEVTADLTFLKEAAYFQGHFPDFPILPGVVQLHFVFEFLREFFHETPTRYTIQKLKFSHLIMPNMTVGFQLEKQAQNEYIFSYGLSGKVCSSGKIVVEEN